MKKLVLLATIAAALAGGSVSATGAEEHSPAPVVKTTIIDTPNGPITESVCFDNCPMWGPHLHNLSH